MKNGDSIPACQTDHGRKQTFQEEFHINPSEQKKEGDGSDREFLLIVEAALLLAFEAGKWEGQVELEEHFDRLQFSEAILEVAYARKTGMPLKEASTGPIMTVTLRSAKWREGVRKSAKEHLDRAIAMVVSRYRQ